MAVTGNLLLDSLSEDLRNNLVGMGKHILLPLRTMLHEQSQMPQYAYFLTSGIASVVVMMPEGGTAEVALIGCEGMVGVMHILGPTPLPAQCFIQMEASALRVRLEDLRTKFQENAELRTAVLEFVQQQAVTTGQIAACNKLHDAESRLARWLLMTRDRAEGDTMHITQEFLADMLGTRRTTVTLVAGSLQRRGLIEYRRGKVTIVSRKTLEQAACDCYRVTKDALGNSIKGARRMTCILWPCQATGQPTGCDVRWQTENSLNMGYYVCSFNAASGRHTAMSPHSSALIQGFAHRKNRDGTYDSICPVCVITVASSNSEEGLFVHERKHVCDESRVIFLKSLPPRAIESDPKKMASGLAGVDLPNRMR